MNKGERTLTLKILCDACGKDDWRFLMNSYDFHGESQKTYQCKNCGHIITRKDLTESKAERDV